MQKIFAVSLLSSLLFVSGARAMEYVPVQIVPDGTVVTVSAKTFDSIKNERGNGEVGRSRKAVTCVCLADLIESRRLAPGARRRLGRLARAEGATYELVDKT